MHYHIILTERCNLRCKYCYEKSMQEFDNGLQDKFTFDHSEPCISQVKIEELKSFIEKDPNPTIIFYGGEPLLQIEKIKQIIDALPNVPFRMQTNAQLLHLLPKEYTNKITKILISIDGNQATTNNYRGKGTYQKIIENINHIKQNGYKGELIARMTVAQDNPDICKNVKHLLSITTSADSGEVPTTSEANYQLPTTNYRIFDSVHWQLDVEFYKTDYDKNKIQNFILEYNTSITKLLQFWTQEIQKGNFINLYPFTGITARLLGIDKETCIMCGAGTKGYAITTSGKIVACPIMNNIKEFECGTLQTNPKNLKQIPIGNWCKNCNYLKICGGRCLYSNATQLWPKEGHNLVCQTIIHLIEEIKKQIPKIQEAIQNKIIKETDFQYEKYFGPEIIP
jgi:uncharacterized protein